MRPGSSSSGGVSRRSTSRRSGPGVPGTLGVAKQTRPRRKETPVEQQRQYVGIDLHRRRSVFVRMTPDGTVLERSRVENSAMAFASASSPRP